MLNIILTSYNRPFFLKRAVESVMAQTSGDWRLFVLDDGSDNEEVNEYLDSLNDKRIEVRHFYPTDEERAASSRYAVLINSVLPALDKGIVGYLCDNVEYDQNLVRSVLDWSTQFEYNNRQGIGYAVQKRDVYDRYGNYLAPAAQFGHWPTMPLESDSMISLEYPYVRGRLDHSQVFHTLPCRVLWNEGIDTVKYGDADFYTRLGEAWQTEYRLIPGAYTLEHILK